MIPSIIFKSLFSLMRFICFFMLPVPIFNCLCCGITSAMLSAVIALRPLDLCDTTPSNQDVHSHGCQGSHASGLALPTQGAVASPLTSSAANSPLQGSAGVVLGNNLSSPSGGVNGTAR